jgi:hypothetical protein
VVFDMRHSTHLGQKISQCHRIDTFMWKISGIIEDKWAHKGNQAE